MGAVSSDPRNPQALAERLQVFSTSAMKGCCRIKKGPNLYSCGLAFEKDRFAAIGQVFAAILSVEVAIEIRSKGPSDASL